MAYASCVYPIVESQRQHPHRMVVLTASYAVVIVCLLWRSRARLAIAHVVALEVPALSIFDVVRNAPHADEVALLPIGLILWGTPVWAVLYGLALTFGTRRYSPTRGAGGTAAGTAVGSLPPPSMEDQIQAWHRYRDGHW